jgi:ribosomal protein S18 acetylase RimI-like enzyme
MDPTDLIDRHQRDSADAAGDVRIRPAIPAEHDALCGLFDALDRLHRAARPDFFRRADGPARPAAIVADLIAGPRSAILVAERDGGLAGLVTVLLQGIAGLPIVVPRRIAVVDNLIVRADCRRQGIGRRLIDRAERWADAQGAQAVEIVVHEFNHEARGFYDALGYRTSTRRLHRRLDVSASSPR